MNPSNCIVIHAGIAHVRCVQQQGQFKSYTTQNILKFLNLLAILKSLNGPEFTMALKNVLGQMQGLCLLLPVQTTGVREIMQSRCPDLKFFRF